jgi:HSP20 family molecular chaperone IbpA
MAKEREPLLEVIEEKEYVVVTAEMPVVPKEAIKARATEASLTISPSPGPCLD